MDELSDNFARDFGLRPQGKSAPMSASKPEAVGLREGSYSAGSSWSTARSGRNPTSTNDPFVSDSGAGISDDYVFVGVLGSSNSSSRGRSGTSSSPTSLDGLADFTTKTSSALPIYDKPVYDDDIFDGAPGLKNSSSAKYEDVFSSILSGSGHVSTPPFADLLQSFQKQMPESKGRSDGRSLEKEEQNISQFDELISGFRRNSPLKDREAPEAGRQKPDASAATPSTNKAEDPFVVLESVSTSAYSSSGLSSDPLENIGRPVSSKNMHSTSKRIFADRNAFDGNSKSVTTSSDEIDERHKERSFLDDFQTKSSSYDELGTEPPHHSFTYVFDNIMPKVEVRKFDDLHSPIGRSGPHTDTHERNTTGDQAPNIYRHTETGDDVWLTVSEVPLRTQPTNAPPPSRPPPPLVIKYTRFNVDAKTKDNEPLQQFGHSHPYDTSSIKRFPLDNLEDFAMSKSKAYAMHNEDIFNSVELNQIFSAAAAMDRGEAKFQHGEEVMEREYDTIFSRNHEYAQQERNEKINFEGKDLGGMERVERLNQERLQKEREDREESKRLEMEREQELEKEREKARQVAERAIREARERAAAEARQKAEKAAAEARQRAERAAVQRAAAEARERAAALARERAEKAAAEVREKAAIEAREKASLEAREKAATEARERAAADARERAAAETRERAAAEARERAVAEARERAEKAAAEAREKVNVARGRAAVERAAAEARQRAQRAAVERAAAEARERAAAAAREKVAAAAAREEQKEENDLESFFGMGSRATSAPKQRSTSSETTFEVKVQNRGGSDGSLRTASGSSSTVRKPSSSANIVDDLSSIFGAPPLSGEFQDIEGESEERRRARLERHQRTQERAMKALAEKNERDLQIQKEQAERHRIAETLDIEIKRWAAGKEGNLRALLSTLHHVLWSECGWQPVSLTDLITGAAVKKVYRKATLCIHPDKVQQKGATLQQKYIAEKVFDLLKEAWNKFNSEELF